MNDNQDHVLSVRSFADVTSETDGIALACSCGQNADVAEGPDEPPDYAAHGEISLGKLNELAKAHQAGRPLRELTAGHRTEAGS